jgi:hypothetical protein
MTFGFTTLSQTGSTTCKLYRTEGSGSVCHALGRRKLMDRRPRSHVKAPVAKKRYPDGDS